MGSIAPTSLTTNLICPPPMTDHPEQPTQQKNRPVCRYYNTENGCRAGDTCPYRHEQITTTHGASSSQQRSATKQQRRYQAPLVDRSKVVEKPQPKIEDARSFQIGQIQRRFNSKPVEVDDGDRFTFNLVPSDPDFPYDLDALQCQLDVPQAYPKHGKPVLRILNKEIPRGFLINIERGFVSLVASNPAATLLGFLNRLDRQLETILSGEMAETIKIVVNKPDQPTIVRPLEEKPSKPRPTSHVQYTVKPTYTPSQKTEAKERRNAETRQLEARFGRLPAFVKSSDGLRYTLPLDSPKKSSWPSPLQTLRICTIIVPELYPLEPPMLVLESESIEARNVSHAFTQKAVSSPTLTLTQLINFFLINIKEMASQSIPEQPSKMVQAELTQQNSTQLPTNDVHTATQTDSQKPIVSDPDRPHLQFISRPPEWDMDHSGPDSEDFSETDDDEYSEDSGSDKDTADETQEQHVYASTPIERGVLLSFPNLELHGIELLELTLLNLTVKCTRCKDTMDVERLRSIITDSIAATANSNTTTAPRHESCKKCAQPMTIGFRADLMHSSSVRAGYLDLDGCTPVDLLPSSFTPTCSECSTPYPTTAPGIVAVRGETAMAICRTCHRKMTLRIQEARFLQVSATAIRTSRLPARKKAKENLGIVAGTELPRRGRCSHYSKSYRWFRFSCCSKVYACDRCHDAEMEHPNEHANRMICGFCSREQNYRPEDCGVCHAVLIGKKGHGFWEGGKGTRDKTKMSRKDPRKYKRVGGGQPRKT